MHACTHAHNAHTQIHTRDSWFHHTHQRRYATQEFSENVLGLILPSTVKKFRDGSRRWIDGLVGIGSGRWMDGLVGIGSGRWIDGLVGTLAAHLFSAKENSFPEVLYLTLPTGSCSRSSRGEQVPGAGPTGFHLSPSFGMSLVVGPSSQS